MSDTELRPCPCGQTPTNIGVVGAGQGGKWAFANPSCCGTWEIEFRTQYHSLDSDECHKLAVEAWNEALRAQELPAEPTEAMIEAGAKAAYRICGPGHGGYAAEGIYKAMIAAIGDE